MPRNEKFLHVRLDDETHELLRVAAFERRTTMSEIVRELIEEELGGKEESDEREQ